MGARNIRVNAICPGYMQTEMTKKFFADGGEWVDRWMAMSPMKRPGTPDELQGVVLYLASDASTFTTGGGYPGGRRLYLLVSTGIFVHTAALCRTMMIY